MPIEAGFCRLGSCVNLTRVQRTEEDFVVRIPGTTNNVTKNTRKEGN